MFELNEVVIHKSAGACVICDIVTRNFGTGDVKYYYLKPKFPTFVNKALEIYLPIEREQEFIRKPLNKTAALALINSIPTLEKEWITDAKTRKLKFEQVHQSGDLKAICKLVKLLYIEPEFFSKPISLTDRNFLNKLRTNLFDEFAVSLNIHPLEVESFIKKYLV